MTIAQKAKSPLAGTNGLLKNTNQANIITINNSEDYAMNFPVIQEHRELIQAVSARELYAFLRTTERFSSWFDRQLQYGFIENQDYLGCEVFNTLANQTLTDFFISIDMAKEISMIQRSEKGRQVRQYFIECERRSQPAFNIPQSYSEALLLAGTLQQKIEQDAPKVAHYDAVADRKTLLNATQVAQSVGIKSAQELNKRLNLVGVYNANCKRGKAFQAWFIEKGLGEMKQGNTGHLQPLFTTKGQMWIYELLSKEVA